MAAQFEAYLTKTCLDSGAIYLRDFPGEVLSSGQKFIPST